MEQQPLLSVQARADLRRTGLILLGFVLVIWFVELVDWLLFDGYLDRLGIVPRSITGLRGVFFAPFLHGGVPHLLANTIPFLVLGALVMARYHRRFLAISAIVVLVGGLGTWLIGPANSLHIGSSVLIFGYIGFLLAAAWRERSAAAILPAILVMVLYGGVLWGVLPQQNGISWQSHLFGFVGGVVAARYLIPVVRPEDEIRVG